MKAVIAKLRNSRFTVYADEPMRGSVYDDDDEQDWPEPGKSDEIVFCKC